MVTNCDPRFSSPESNVWVSELVKIFVYQAEAGFFDLFVLSVLPARAR